jgi:hypothetical protein
MTITSLSLDGMMRIVQSMGFNCTRDKDGKFFTFQAEGYKAAMFVFNKDTDAQLYAAFTDTKPTSAVVNEWNKMNRFSKAYTGEQGEATLTADLDFTGGVTDQNIQAFVRLFRDSLVRYARYCVDKVGYKAQ